MKRRQGADPPDAGVVFAPPAAELQNALRRVKQFARRGAAEEHQEIGVGQFDLALDERPADGGLLRRRASVSRRTPRHDVGDVDVGAAEADRGEHPVEQLPGPPDEGQPLDILVPPGPFADKHDPTFRVAVGEDKLRRGEAEVAPLEAIEGGAQLVER